MDHRYRDEVKLSVALIVKDEEICLERCLSSIKDIADEIVIVDTGSTDKTLEIAKKFTDKIFHFKWIKDFSAARNFSFEKCSGDFILWLDADDVIRPVDAKKIKEMDYSDKEIIVCKYEYMHDENDNVICSLDRERIIKRSLGLKWEMPIHEYLPLNGKIFKSDIEIHHYRIKLFNVNRNLEILEEFVEKDPTNPRMVYYLGKEYFEQKIFDKATFWLKKFITMPYGWIGDKFAAQIKLAEIYYPAKDNKFSNENSFKYHCYSAIQIEERRPEPYYFLGTSYFDHGIWEKAAHWYTICVNYKPINELTSSILPKYYTFLPNLNLAVCYANLGDFKKSFEYNENCLKFDPTNQKALGNRKWLLDKINEKKDGQGKSLNLGCGSKVMPGYINVDVFKADYIDEVFQLDDIPYKDKTIKRIYSEHSLEHVIFKRGERAIREWFRVLEDGGELILKIPDLEECCRAYLNANTQNLKDWYIATIFGWQRALALEEDEFQVHRAGYSCHDIRKLLESTGFIIDFLEKYDGYDTPSIGTRAIKPKSNLKVGFIAPINWDAAQVRIRILNVDRWLRSRGYQSKVLNYPEIINQKYDVAVVGKVFDKSHFLNIKLLKQHGITVYCDLCEDILEHEWVQEIIKICDKIICCSDVLAEKVKIINNNTCVIEDAWEC